VLKVNCVKEHLDIVLGKVLDAVISIDRDGLITIVNDKAKELLKLKGSDFVSKKIDEVIVGSELMRVIETGKEEINIQFSYQGRQFIVDRSPIICNGIVQGAIAVFHDITYINEMSEKIEEDKVYIDTLDTIIDTCSERVVVVDEQGIITMMSNSYKEFVRDMHPEGKHVTEVIENTRLHVVLETGEAERGDIQVVNGHRTVAMRIPIRQDGKIIGAVGKVLFKDISELVALSKKTSILEKELKFLKSELNKERTAKYSFKSLAGDSKAINEVKNLAMRVARTDSNVLVNGESGTGKELFVHAIHNASERRNKPFIKINCAAIPAELLESELFGYADGAFTGAKKGGKIGKFEMANGGTLLLDEIGDMPLSMQAKLLRVLQEKEVEKIGSNEVNPIDVRIIAATNRDLSKLSNTNEFRSDLYYRLNVMNIKLPPLRERIEDIDKLAQDLCLIVGNRLGIYVEGVSEGALKYMKAYDWPGNIRELENVIERAINLLDSNFIIEPRHLPITLTRNKCNKIVNREMNLKKKIEDLEKETIKECLEATGHNKNQAAQILNISRVSLYKKIEKYGI